MELAVAIYRRQQELRRLEKQYNLVSLEQGNAVTSQPDNSIATEQHNILSEEQPKPAAQRALTNDEI